MSTVVGPFTVEDADLLGQASAAAAAIPAEIAGPSGWHHIWSSRRFGAPAWSYGYTPNRSNSWCNPSRHVVAHEFFHAWWARHGSKVGGNDALLALVDRPELVGSSQTEDSTNRLSEAGAHAFAAAVGEPDGVREAYFRVKIPPANYGALVALMSKALAGETRPTHTLRRSQQVALRREARADSEIIGWAVSGDEIRAEVGLSGGLYSMRALDNGDGCRSRLWLVVTAHNGRPLSEPAYTASLAWVPRPALPSAS